MEPESFEDPKIAELLNRGFVAIKVDREERPDLDDIYMKAVQALSGAGGWPMSVFLTPELQPFFGGTYFPPDDRYGRPGFPKILRWVEKLWSEDRERVLEQAKTMTGYITAEASMESVGDLDPGILDHSLRSLESNFDSRWGGFGAAPKFPHALDLRDAIHIAHSTGFKADPGLPHGMITTNADEVNADLLAFVEDRLAAFELPGSPSSRAAGRSA